MVWVASRGQCLLCGWPRGDSVYLVGGLVVDVVCGVGGLVWTMSMVWVTSWENVYGVGGLVVDSVYGVGGLVVDSVYGVGGLVVDIVCGVGGLVVDSVYGVVGLVVDVSMVWVAWWWTMYMVWLACHGGQFFGVRGLAIVDNVYYVQFDMLFFSTLNGYKSKHVH